MLPDYEGANLAGRGPGSPATARAPAGLDSRAGSPRRLRWYCWWSDGLGWLQLQDRRHLTPQLVGPCAAAPSLRWCRQHHGDRPDVADGGRGPRACTASWATGVVVDGTDGPRGAERAALEDGVGRRPRASVDPAAFQPRPPFQGRPVPVVSKSEFVGTGFTEAHQRDAPVAGWSLASSLAVEVRALLEAGEPFVYAYYEGIDKIAHMRGFGAYYDAELVAVDRMVGDLLEALPPGAALAVTADHGQVEVGSRATADRRRAGGGGGHAERGGPVPLAARPRPGAARAIDRLTVLAEAVYGDQAWVVTVDQMETSELVRRTPAACGAGPAGRRGPHPLPARRLSRSRRRRRRPAGLPARIAHRRTRCWCLSSPGAADWERDAKRSQTGDQTGPDEVLDRHRAGAGVSAGTDETRSARPSSSRPR